MIAAMSVIEKIKADPRVEEISIECATDDGYWVYLKSGFICAASECHAVHEWTMRALWASFKTVKPCMCKDCKKS